jgi:hypothetical protein
MFLEPGIPDANVLAYAINADASQHAASRALLEAARDPSIRLYVTSQILCEFYSVVTNPRRVAVAFFSHGSAAHHVGPASSSRLACAADSGPAQSPDGWHCYSVIRLLVETYSTCKLWRPCRSMAFSEYTLSIVVTLKCSEN